MDLVAVFFGGKEIMSASCFHSFRKCVEYRKGLSSESFLVEGVLENKQESPIKRELFSFLRKSCGVSQGLIIGNILGERSVREQAGLPNK